jgi:putative transposase
LLAGKSPAEVARAVGAPRQTVYRWREVLEAGGRERMTKDLVIDALRMAWFRRRPLPGLIHHSDRGSQYCSHDYQEQLADYGMLPSRSRKGNCWDTQSKITSNVRPSLTRAGIGSLPLR